MLHARGALRLAVRRRDPLAGAVMWAHDAQVHMLVLPAQTANSEGCVLTSCGTRDLPVVHVVRNEGSIDLVMVVVSRVPAGSERRVDEPNPGNCPFPA